MHDQSYVCKQTQNYADRKYHCNVCAVTAWHEASGLLTCIQAA